MAPRSARALAPFAITLITFVGAASAPSPLYGLYQKAWGFSSLTLTAIFAVYAGALLLTLLITGSLSDHLGRRPVILSAIVLEIIAMALFSRAEGVSWLIAARLTQGVATGLATAALGAALIDIERTRGTLTNTVGSLAGMAIGALATATLIQLAPTAGDLVFPILMAIFIGEGLWIAAQSEPATPRPGAWASLKPSVGLPRAARRTFLLVAPIDIAIWALGGFYLSLGPALARGIATTPLPILGGLAIFALAMTGAGAIVVFNSLSPHRQIVLGAASMAGGVALTLLAAHGGGLALFFGGTVLAGIGFGVGFQGAVRSVMPLAGAGERAGLLAALYILSYASNSLPALAAGGLVGSFGLARVGDVYGGLVVALSLLALAGALVFPARSCGAGGKEAGPVSPEVSRAGCR
ncbi:MFS transporter [Rhodospirillum rubrum]|nr:MFS transporter [Rhodospirillum rubrum]